MAKDRLIDGASTSERGKAKRARTQGRSHARGRAIVGALLIGFVLVASAVIWRRSSGIALSHDLVDLDRHRAALVAEQARLRGM